MDRCLSAVKIINLPQIITGGLIVMEERGGFGTKMRAAALEEPSSTCISHKLTHLQRAQTDTSFM